MAIFSANIAVDFSSPGSFFVAGPSSVLEATSSLIRLVTPDGNYQDYSGSFSYYYSNGYQYLSWAGSTLYSITAYSSEWALLGSVTGMSIPGSTYEFYANNNDLAGLKTYFFKGNDTITGSNYSDVLWGYAGNDIINGGSGADTLNGGSGADTMIGGSGNDTYIVNNVADITTETSTLITEIDTVNSSVTRTLGANLENLTLTGSAAINGIGNGLHNHVTGNSAANILNGRSGADTMVGRNGSDIYYIDDFGDIVSETNGVASTGGTDLVCSPLSAYTLDANVENGRVMSTAAADLTGNELNNILYAGVGNNVLDGGTGTDSANYSYTGSAVTVNLAVAIAQDTSGSGSDTLISIENLAGSNYNDTLTGNADANVLKGRAGNDTLDGGEGADVMIGGDGNDTYYVDNALDVVTETTATSSTGGKDTVYSTIDYTLAANIENIRILGTDAVNATGNTLNNMIYAGAGDNTINGKTGADTAAYTYATDGVNVSLAILTAQATSGSGSDTLLSIENLVGSDFNDTLTGNTLANTLNGKSGDDVLVGGKGKDSLTGGLGADFFDFNAIVETGLTNATWDVINDFNRAQGDKIDLSTIDAKMSVAGDQAFIFIGGKVFNSTNAAGQLRFDSATHILYGSTDADSAAEFAIQLSGMTSLVASDFIV